MYLGDYAEDYADLNFKFTTRDTDAAPFTLAGSPVISVYKGNATATEKTSAEAYITLTIDFDGKTGLNHVDLDLSGDAFFAVGNDYSVVITAGSVNSNSVVGEVVAHFSIENRFDEVDATKLGGSAAALANLKAVYTGVLTGLAKTGTLTDTVMTTDLTEATNALVDSAILYTNGNLQYESQRISAYSVTNGQITVASPFTEAPANNDAFVIIGNLGSS